MADDGDSGGIGDVVSDIADTAGDVGGSILDELKKFGKSATSQVTGSEPAPDNTISKASGAKQTSAGTGDEDHSIIGEFKKLGQAAIGQVTGHEQAAALLAMKKKDDAASKREYAQVSAKIKQMYQEYAAKKAREQRQEEVIKEHRDEQQKQLQEIKKKEEPRADIQKTRAEIKDYGAE